GMATYIEACAFAGSEPAYVRLNDDGGATILIGTQSNGQGHATAYAQLVAEKLDLDVDRISLHQGDTDELAKGGGTGGSRSIPLGATAVDRASVELREVIVAHAADELEAAPGDIELVDGVARIAGTDREIALVTIAEHVGDSEKLTVANTFTQEAATFPNGAHIAEVEIDPETGAIEVVAYTIVDDFGVTLNPLLLEGQVHGGVAQGLGQAIHEHTVYDDDGQLLTASFLDYAVPRAVDLPNFSFETRNVPCTTNPLGIKGAGEAGIIGAAPAAVNAILDALNRGAGITCFDMPATPYRVWQAIRDARARA
ncbi:MAG: molybdopterin-dependent oxidoreductase, partial [Hyphomicrobiales bacterium]|nr:molybdopterin-dependent oxidoreductase [Hyphomicrobiales bacterium]